jgi:hypothetical protein
MHEPTPATRFTLRDLSLPARLVLSAFLIAVAIGYTSAMVQLHFQHSSRDGGYLPSKENVVEKFHGRKDLTSPLVKQITGPETGNPDKGDNMTPAFFKADGGEYKKACRKRPEAEVHAERVGERDAVLAWVKDGLRKEYYQEDAFPLPADLKDRPLTEKFNNDGKAKIRSIFTERCGRCHDPQNGMGNAVNFPLDNYEAIAKYAKVSRGFMSVEKLTQSTHAHLLSFAVLYCLTGLIFAFTSWPGLIRGILGPLVLVAQVADIACWWLARIEGPLGEQFAEAILVTGAVVGVGLTLQIVLSLWNMYPTVGGKLLLILLAGAIAYGGYVLYEKVIVPHLAEEAAAFKAANAEAEKGKVDGNKTKEDGDAPEGGPARKGGKGKAKGKGAGDDQGGS